MLANYGYKDASGDFFITVDTGLCNGCGNCVAACPSDLFELADEDPNDPLRLEPVALVADDKKNKIKYECNPCRLSAGRFTLPCIEACKARAITHSW